MANTIKEVKVKSDGRLIEVYKLQVGTPTENHVWCNLKGCTETFTEAELEFKPQTP